MDKSFLKVGHSTVNNFLTEDGELLDSIVNTTKYLANSKEEFYLMYSSLVVVLEQSTDVRIKLFAGLLKRYSAGQEFSLSNALKKRIAEETGCSYRSFDNATKYLSDNNIIVKLGDGLYRINPRHIFKGSTLERNKQLKIVLELHCKDC